MLGKSTILLEYNKYILRENQVIIFHVFKIFGKSISRDLLKLPNAVIIYCLALKGYLLILYEYFNR